MRYAASAFILLFSAVPALWPAQVTRVDFLSRLGLDVNGAGPLLIRTDPPRNRVVLVNTYTSSVTLIAGGDHSVINIAIGSRVPQYLKSECFAIDSKTGEVYVIGQSALHVVDPGARRCKSVETPCQFEMVAVDEASGDAYLVGRESRSLGIFRARSGDISYVPFAEKEEKLVNLNMTPPPPIRKVVFDATLKRVIAIDGYTSTLMTFDPSSGKMLSSRRLELVSGARWHYAGYNREKHRLYVVVETAERRVVQAAQIDVTGEGDVIVELPQLTEAVGVIYNPAREEVYIPYDNHPTVHVVSFADDGGSLEEIKIPAYGNDATALDEAGDRLYVASWAWSEVDRIDLKSRRLERRYLDMGVIPHQFSAAFNPADGLIYLPLGATAVNGVFGAAVTLLDPSTGARQKVLSGWAPVELIQRPAHESFLVFNSEDEMAEVQPDGSFQTIKLPCTYPHQAVPSPEGNVYLSYGPHQSYWPVVYIWGAKNGILGIDSRSLEFYDRRIPELSQGMAVDARGVLYSLQNNWGEQKQYLVALPDEVRAPNMGDMRIELDDTVNRETTQRILKHDEALGRLYIGRIGENDGDPGVLQLFDIESRKVVGRLLTGLTPADIVFDERSIYVANFDSNSVTVVDKAGEARQELPVGRGPLKLAICEGIPFVINHLDNTLQEVRPGSKPRQIPFAGLPDDLAACGKRLVLTSHSTTELAIMQYDPASGRFELLHRERYPFGETRFDTGNTAFYQRGQFGDAIFEITRIREDAKNRLWVTDFLAGKLFIIQPR
ncbi:MAG: hypothetical protein AB1714_13600 [Acidobacteriota bacterium]